MPPDQGEIEAEHLEQVIAGLKVSEEFLKWLEPYLQQFPNGNWMEPDLGNDFFAEPEDEIVEYQLVVMEEWTARKEDEELMIWEIFQLP